MKTIIDDLERIRETISAVACAENVPNDLAYILSSTAVDISEIIRTISRNQPLYRDEEVADTLISIAEKLKQKG